MTQTLAHGYSSQSTLREIFNEYPHDRVLMIFRSLCALVFDESSLSIVRGEDGRRWGDVGGAAGGARVSRSNACTVLCHTRASLW